MLLNVLVALVPKFFSGKRIINTLHENQINISFSGVFDRKILGTDAGYNKIKYYNIQTQANKYFYIKLS